MIIGMSSLNLADTFVTFLALLGPQKVLLSFARIARTRDPHTVRLVAAAAGICAACIGTACALSAPWLVSFFHISTPALELSAGILFFVYAFGLVLGIHFDPTEAPVAPDSRSTKPTDPQHPVGGGFREMLLPFVVSPLAVAAAILGSASATGWGARWIVVLAFALVTFIDMGAAMVFSALLGRMHEILLEMLSRLLGVLLAAVGMQLFLQGLQALGVLPGSH